MVEERKKQIELNYKAFEKILPSLLAGRRGKFALMRDGEIVEFYDTARDAVVSGRGLFEDGLFSVQEVADEAIDLGYFSHAVPQQPV